MGDHLLSQQDGWNGAGPTSSSSPMELTVELMGPKLFSPKVLAEREGFYLPSFRKSRRYLDLNDIILYSCVFQADSQSTFRVLPSTSGYSQHHEKRKESVSVVSPNSLTM